MIKMLTLTLGFHPLNQKLEANYFLFLPLIQKFTFFSRVDILDMALQITPS